MEWSSGAGLYRRPFLMVPKPERFVSIAEAGTARESLSRCVSRGEGIGLLIGASGTGKSLICQCLYEQFLEESGLSDVSQVVLLQPGAWRRAAQLAAALLAGLGGDLPERADGAVIRSMLERFLTTLERSVLVIVDPVDRLSIGVWQEIQSLVGFCHEGHCPLRWIFAGSMALEERLTHPHLASLNQRVAVRAYLRAWNATETRRYIESQIRAAKGDPARFFTESGMRRIHQLTDGVPQRVNQLCDRVLWRGLSEDEPGPYGSESAQAAWNEMEGIAAEPANDPAHATDGGEVDVSMSSAADTGAGVKISVTATGVEYDSVLAFGSLDDEESEEESEEEFGEESDGERFDDAEFDDEPFRDDREMESGDGNGFRESFSMDSEDDGGMNAGMNGCADAVGAGDAMDDGGERVTAERSSRLDAESLRRRTIFSQIRRRLAR